MEKNFLKFRRKVRRGAFISAVLLGLGTGIFALAVLMLILKLCALNFSPIYYAAGGALAMAVGAALYFILTPSDKRLARRLDETYSLDEKISTMIEFRGDDGIFPTLQRDDADERLGQKPIKLMRSRSLIAAILVFTLSVACMAGALIVPAKAEGDEIPLDAFEKEWLLVALDELILKVQNSYMCEPLKTSSKEELTSLKVFVEEHELMSEMKAEAITTIKNISAVLTRVNTAVLIGERFKGSANEYIAAIGKELTNLTGTGTRGAMEDFAATFDAASYDDLSFFGDEISSYLASSGVRSDDPIYSAFKVLAEDMKVASKTALVDGFETTGKSLSTEIIVQNVNRATVTEVNTELCNLFGIASSELDSDIPIVDEDTDRLPSDSGGNEDGEDDKDDITAGTGGLGTGDAIYGSTDIVFDPDTNTYVPYGDIINEYFGKANEQILDGKTDDEISDAVEDYFGTLFGGTDENSN